MMWNRILRADSDKSILLRNVACAITMDNDGFENPDLCDEKSLHVQRGVDIRIENGKFVSIAPAASGDVQADEVLDASRWTVMPGLVDTHNHPVFGGSRAKETVLKAQGMSYEEIAKRGGGISNTMVATRNASSEELRDRFVANAQNSLRHGVVLMDAKTGYGLNPKEELRQLDCILDGIAREPMLPRIVPCILGPHAMSPDYPGLADYVQALVEALPEFASKVQAARAKGRIGSASVDIFVERNYFTREHAETWIGSALQYGFDAHIHADEFSRSGGIEVAIALAERQEQSARKRRAQGRILSVDHCQYTPNEDFDRLQVRGIAVTALPSTSFFSGIPFVDARHWRASGVRVAIGTDFNPGSSPMNNIWFSAFLALTRGGFTVPEVLAGVTRSAAWALGAEATHGVLAVGRPANLVAFEGTQPEDFFASPLGEHVRCVILNG